MFWIRLKKAALCEYTKVAAVRECQDSEEINSGVNAITNESAGKVASRMDVGCELTGMYFLTFFE
ncbi:hypothetical protein MNBD_GAMMA10-3162 [hydrothermal vent metagenome]|uniref:Uncharacterized protein n=1 Tax=hydrothermal vent metagenome TaxID=652676 RepID=A0A3B0XX36_9ZZZZ